MLSGIINNLTPYPSGDHQAQNGKGGSGGEKVGIGDFERGQITPSREELSPGETSPVASSSLQRNLRIQSPPVGDQRASTGKIKRQTKIRGDAE